MLNQKKPLNMTLDYAISKVASFLVFLKMAPVGSMWLWLTPDWVKHLKPGAVSLIRRELWLEIP
jgi:hypothetical protein